MWGLMLSGVWGFWDSYGIATSFSATAADARSLSSSSSKPTFEPRGPRIDVYGNVVHHAIAQYEIDVEGDVYERHSPETALPKVGRSEM